MLLFSGNHDNMTEIHMPSKDGNYISLSVSPDKKYNGISGATLIQLYGKRYNKRLLADVEVNGNKIYIPSGYLTKESIEILKQVESKTGISILCKCEPRAKKIFWHHTIEFK